MKLRIFSLVVNLAAVLAAVACYAPSYRNQDMQMFRAVPYGFYPPETSYNDDRQENLHLWVKDIGQGVTTADVEDIVYRATLADLRSLTPSTNAFAAKLLAPANKPLYECLLLAKEVEEIRVEMADPWYYAVADDDTHQRLHSLLDKCLAAMDGPLAQRYGVQALRIYVALKQYQDIVDFWQEHESVFADNVLRRIAADYVGGAYEHLSDPEAAKKMYVASQNLLAISLVNSGSGSDDSASICDGWVNEIENIFSIFPNHPKLREKLQNVVADYENSIKYFSDFRDSVYYVTRGDTVGDYKAYARLRDFAVKAAKSPGVDSPALWFYTAAYIEYLNGHDSQAAKLLARAEKSRASDFDRESIRAFRFLFDSETRGLSRSEYLSYLKWIEPKMIAEIKDFKDKDFSIWDVRDGYSVTFWYDVVRKVCERSADRLTAKGDISLALALSNYASYAGLPYFVYREFIYDPEDKGYNEKTLDFDQSREYWQKGENPYDFANPFFERLDSVTPAQAAAFTHRMLAPQDDFDRFIANRGYVDPDYLNDHVGTLYMRNMDYASAVNWLSRVSADYQQRTNVRNYMKLDPFQWLDVDHRISDPTDYKLKFARQMLALQQQVASERDPNRRANARLNYAIGLRNSFGRCWALNFYDMTSSNLDYEDVYGPEGYGYGRISDWRAAFSSPLAKKAYKIYDSQVDKALSEFTSDELRAQTLLRMKNFKTLVNSYPNTQAARIVTARCDRYIDYAVHRR